MPDALRVERFDRDANLTDIAALGGVHGTTDSELLRATECGLRSRRV
jgi:hypothetical protein